ncbi:MAG: chemotaxis protein CheB [Candidatus Acidiferrales bacterium]
MIGPSSTNGKASVRRRGAADRAGVPPAGEERSSSGPEAGRDGKLRGKFPVIAVGASAGGLEALQQLLQAVPRECGSGMVLVQHLSPDRESLLPELLKKFTSMTVVEVKNGMRVQQDRVHVIPAGAALEISGGLFRLLRPAAGPNEQLPIDRLFASLAADLGEKAIGVVLSGNGFDGSAGIKAIKTAGGLTFAQDDQTARHGSMPGSAVATGCVDFVGSPQAIAIELGKIGRHPYFTEKSKVDRKCEEAAAPASLARMYSLLETATGVDFSHYKEPTVLRRIRRRVILKSGRNVDDYVASLGGNAEEMRALYEDLLIHVTDFFREPEVFKMLQQRVFPEIVKEKSAGEAIRIWVPGCSTGEEAFSLAICATEFLEAHKLKNPVQIFATDVEEKSLAAGRLGKYPESDLSGVSAERLGRFFVVIPGGRQVRKEIRETCVFARQNLIKDPPFSRMDLISCRNLLIYLKAPVQKKLLPIFHYALQPRAFLLLGKSESPDFSGLFSAWDKKNKIYQKRRHSGDSRVDGLGRASATVFPVAGKAGFHAPAELDFQREVNRLLLESYTPPGLVVNGDLEIVHFHGRIGPYLDPQPGTATLRLLKMAREGFPFELRMAIQEVKKTGNAAARKGIRFTSSGVLREVDIEVRTIAAAEPLFLVLFRNDRPVTDPKGLAPEISGGAASALTQRLRRELEAAKVQVREVIHDHDANTQELRAANEEIQSTNEELQSTNEELETAKEELQASNEELTTLNEELQDRNLDLIQLNSDLTNVFGNVYVPMVIVDREMRLRRFTPSAAELFKLVPADIGRPIGEMRSAVDFGKVKSLISEAMTSGSLREQDVTDVRGAWHSLRVRPYQATDGQVDGAVLTFVDIDALKSEAAESRQYAENISETVREALAVLDEELRILAVNASFLQTFRVMRSEVENQLLPEIGNGQWSNPRLLTLLRDIIPAKVELKNFELTHEFPHIGQRTMLLNARQMYREKGTRKFTLLAIEDITEGLKATENIRKQSELLHLAHDAIIVRDLDSAIAFWNRGAQEMYGWTGAEAVGKITHDLLKTEFPESIESVRDHLFGQGWWYGQLVHSTRTGKRIFVESRQVLQRNGEGQATGIMEINRDVTRRREAEESLRNLSARLLQLQDEERQRIARELHDSTGQSLAALVIHLSAVTEKLTGGDSDTLEILREAIGLAQQASDETRTLSYLLYPPTLDFAGLKSALEWYVDGLKKRSKMKVDLDLSLGPERLPQKLETVLFRIVQEGLTNVFRHAETQSATVRIARDTDRVSFEIADKGKGIPPELLETLNGPGGQLGVGIRGMRERARQLGGWMMVHSSEQGTAVRGMLPSKPEDGRVGA